MKSKEKGSIRRAQGNEVLEDEFCFVCRKLLMLDEGYDGILDQQDEEAD